MNAGRSLVVGAELDALPASLESLEQGRIGFGHLALIAETQEAVRNHRFDGPTLPESTYLDRAEEQTVFQFQRECTQLRHATDPERFLREHVGGMQDRTLEFQSLGDGSLIIKGWLDAVGGATVRSSLEPLAHRTGAADERLRNRRLADALVEMAHLTLDSGTLPITGGVKPHLTVTAELATLMGISGAPGGELEGAGVVPIATVQRLACDATIRRVVFDAKGAVIDAGRSRRVASPAQVAALRARDRGCVWPRCERTARLTAAHHVDHWAQLGVWGRTDVSNMVLLCHRHHMLVHEGGWQLVRTEDGRWVVVRPPFSMWPDIRGRPRPAA